MGIVEKPTGQEDVVPQDSGELNNDPAEERDNLIKEGWGYFECISDPSQHDYWEQHWRKVNEEGMSKDVWRTIKNPGTGELYVLNKEKDSK